MQVYKSYGRGRPNLNVVRADQWRFYLDCLCRPAELFYTREQIAVARPFGDSLRPPTFHAMQPTLPPDYFDQIKKQSEENVRLRAERRRTLWSKDIAREVRLVAWIDILGFSDELLRATTDDEYRAVYRKMLRVHDEFGHPHANDEPEQQDKINRDFGREVLVLSDGLIVTATPNAAARRVMPAYDLLMDFIQDIQWAQANCAANGIFLRGGISIGPYHYDDDILLSPALIRAYRLESKRACFPVIIINAKDMAQLAALSGAEDHGAPHQLVRPFKSPAQKRGERFFFIDYLDYLRWPNNHGWFSDADRKAHARSRDAKARNRIFTTSHRKEAARFMRLHKRHLMAAFQGAVSPRVKAKYRWLMKYQNRALQGFPAVFNSARIDLASLSEG